MENSKIYLCKADCSILGNISGLKIETCSLKKYAIVQWELTFEVERYTNDNLCELKQTDYYDSIDTMMRLYLDGKEQAFFVIDEEPAIHGEGLQETKTVTAHSIECELSYLNIKNFKINCGTKDSQEYLVTDSTGNFNNINPYTNLPYEYISLVNYNNPQLSLLHLVLQNTGWAVDENINAEICNIKKSFEVSNENIYSFLMDAVSSSASVIFQFDRKNKKITLVKAKDFGEDTGIFISMRNLINRFEINSSSNDELITKLIPTGSNNLGIEQVNFGKDYIINLDYFMNTLNEYGDYKYVSKELHDKYIIWQNYRETDKITFNGKQYTRREQYIELTKLYNHTILAINDLKNRVPNDGAVTDYKTFSLEELKLHLNAFNKALVSLITIYKNEYGVTEIGNAPNYTPTPSSAVNIKNTPYWHDFYAYQESIIPQIKEALKMYCQTDSNGNLMTDINGHFIEMGFGNPAYYADPSIVKEVDAYKYEWSLYGLDELESKKKAWSEVSNILFNECFIKSGTIAAPTSYRTPDDNGWNSLSDKQRKEFTSKSAYIDKLNQYLDYMSFDERSNSLTKTKCKGIIRLCNDAILTRKNEIKSLEDLQNNYSVQRINLANSVSLENFKANNNVLFTEKDLNVINSMIREKDYNDPNVLITNLDDIVSTINAQEELYQAAIEELYILSQPQYSFQTELDNLYALEEFQSYHDDFDVGNFIRVGLEIHEEIFNFDFRKLRLISIEYNPLQSDENLSIEFSTMERGLENVSDMSFLIGKDNSTSSGGSSSSSGGGGTYGNNDANVQMSNNMLNALLSTELFGTTITDVILDSIKANKGNFNTLLSHSGIFDSLEAGRIKISGECIFDFIRSSNFCDIEGTEAGSMMSMTDGSFSFAGGLLSYKPGSGLIIKGYADKDTVDTLVTDINGLGSNFTTLVNGLATGETKIYGGCLSTGNIISQNYNGGTIENPIGNTQGSILCLDDGRFNFGGGKLKFDGNNLNVDGDITANTLYANGIGSIAGWTFNNVALFKKDFPDIGQKGGAYLGTNGMSIGDYFVVNQDGVYLKSNIIEPPIYGTSIGYIGYWSSSNPLMKYYYSEDPNSGFYSPSSKDQYMKIYLYNTTNAHRVAFRFYYYCEYRLWSYLDGTKSNSYSRTFNNVHTAEPEYSTNGENVYSITIGNWFMETLRSYLGMEPDKGKTKYNEETKEYEYDSDDSNIYILSLSILGIECINALDIGMQSPSVVQQIGRVDTYNGNGTRSKVTNGQLLNNPKGMTISTYAEQISSRNFVLNSSGFSHSSVYNSTTSSSPNLCISSGGSFLRSSSSSRRYKTDVTENINEKISPEKLYDINVVSYKYKKDYLPLTDQRYGKDIIGFITEDIYEKYPIACNFDENGLPEMWNINILFPAALKLIQEQHKEIIALSDEIESMKQQFQEIKTCINNQNLSLDTQLTCKNEHRNEEEENGANESEQ